MLRATGEILPTPRSLPSHRYLGVLASVVLGLATAGTLRLEAKPSNGPAELKIADDSTRFRAEAVTLTTPSATLHGTLQIPSGPGSTHAVALLISGSGPTDRDGNTGPQFQSGSLRMLAEALAAQGIASLRYDKRGVGQSQVRHLKEDDLRFDDLVDDAARWMEMLRGDGRFSSLTVVGHSEGALIGMVAARTAGVDAMVSIAGTSLRAARLLEGQVQATLPPAMAEEAGRILAELEAGRVGEVPAALHFLFRPSVMPYLISWNRYDPLEEIARLSIPVLVVQGTTDLQVAPASGPALSRANPRAELLQIDGMNHVLKMVSHVYAEQIASYMDPALPVSPELVDGIGRFIEENSPG